MSDKLSVIHVHGIVHFAENPIYGPGECKACDRMHAHFVNLLNLLAAPAISPDVPQHVRDLRDIAKAIEVGWDSSNWRRPQIPAELRTIADEIEKAAAPLAAFVAQRAQAAASPDILARIDGLRDRWKELVNKLEWMGDHVEAMPVFVCERELAALREELVKEPGSSATPPFLRHDF